MTRFFNALRNALCIVGLVALGSYTYNYYYQPTQKKLTHTMVKTTSTQTANKPTVTQEKPVPETKKLPDTLHKAITLLNQVKEHAERGYNYLQQDETIDTHKRNQLLAQCKEIISQADHLDKYIHKGPSEKTTPEHPERQSAQTIYENTIQRKSLAIAKKIEAVLTNLVNETTEQKIEMEKSTTVTESVAHNNKLLQALSTTHEDTQSSTE